MIRGRFLLLSSLACLFAAGGVRASTELDQARDLHRQGRLREALEAYAKAIDVAGDSDPESIAAARNNACVIRIGFAEYQAALEQCAEAVRLRRELDDPPRLARALNNLGIIEQNLGDFDAASEAFQEALQINRARDDPESQVINLSNLGTLESIQGRYAAAFEHHNRAAALASQHPDADWSAARRRIALINRGVVFEKVGAYQDALEDLREARSIEAEQDPRELAQLLINLGVVYRNLGDPVIAVDLFTQARTLYETLEDDTGITQTEINLAHAYHFNLERPEEAESSYRTAHRLAHEIGDRPLEIETTLYLARFLAESAQLSRAEAMFEAALRLSQESGSSEGEWSALTGLGDIAVAQGDQNLAWERYREAVDEIDRVRGDITGLDLRADYLRDKRPVFAKAVQVLSELAAGTPDETFEQKGFELVQRAKARSLIDALGQSANRMQPMDVNAVASRLDRAALLEYFVTESRLLVWAVDRNGARLFDLGPPEETLALADSIYRTLSSNREPTRESLLELSSRLLPEDASHFWQQRRLYVAADAELRRIPFELLPTPDNPEKTLLETVSLSYLPSASAMRPSDASSRRHGLEVAGFANPRLETDDDGSESLRDGLIERFSLQPLDASEFELESLARWLPQPQRLRRGTEATESAFAAALSDSPRILHIGAHSIIDDRLGLGTAIVLSPADGNDGLLFPREVAGLEGAVGLSVLAACRTAVDSDRGVSSLNTLIGALLASGSSSVLATLWDVGDEATAVFMNQFYYRIGRGMSGVDALRQTKLAMMEDPGWSSPSIWSAYVLVGSFPGLEAKHRWITLRGLLVPVAAAVLALLLLMGYRRRRLRRL